ncbi:MAG: GDP-mannose 4,6-dehydratase [Thermoleophilaceae bacterium]|nr:GDP-mannose 4,6-dehydratase [Thermoleophilaceae bacterium]
MSGRYAGRVALVTGAQGFIGSWLTERLLDEGARVVVPRRDSPAVSRFRLQGLEARCDVVTADLIDYAPLARVLNEYSVDTVFHLAAQTIVGTANRSPLSTFESNIRGSYNLLEACRSVASDGHPIDRIVVASSDKAYGSHEVLPYREEFELKATYPYDVSKACTDMIARSYAITYELPVAVTRLANVYGGGDFNFSRIVPDSARSLLAGERPVIRSDGSPQRDYIYAADAVEGYLTVADSLDRPELRGRAWNLGAGELISVAQIVGRLIAAAGSDLEADIRGEGVPPGEIDRQQLDSTRIREQLGWAPRWSLDRGLAETYDWYRAVLV